jgi:cellulose synthase/poly-beta-1,6-N-acetylglucosamine synthase-like glycosyltransferase
MGAYTFSPPAVSSKMAEMSSLAVLLKNYIRPLGLHQLGLPCLLNGSGSTYPFTAIRNAPHGEGSIAEDFPLTVDLQKMGYRTNFSQTP